MSTYILICSISYQENPEKSAITTIHEFSWIRATHDKRAIRKGENILSSLLDKRQTKVGYQLTALLLRAHVKTPVWSYTTGCGKRS